MSTPTIVYKDESTQTTPPLATAPSPGTTPAKKPDVASQSPTPSLLHPERQTDEGSETSADETAAPAGTGVEPSPKEIPLLGTVPDDLGPACDYLGKVKELADEIEPGLYDKYFEEHFTEQDHTFTGFYKHDQDSETEHLFSCDGLPSPPIFSDIETLQENFFNPSNQEPSVLVVEAINKAGIQAIGMALNVNPCFFAIHLGSKHGKFCVSDQLERLTDMFDDFVMSRSQDPDTTRHRAERGSDYESSIGYLTYDPSVRKRPIPDRRRITIGNDNVGRSLSISDTERSRNCWIILADLPIPTYHKGLGPFSHANMINFKSQYLPERVSDFNYFQFNEVMMSIRVSRQLLLDADRIEAHEMLDLLVGYIILDIWRSNVRLFETRLNRCKHDALENPTLKAFATLTLHRRNLADLEDAVRAAKGNFTLATNVITLKTLPEDNDAKTGTTKVRYDRLLERVKAMSTSVSYEMQLIIGSVTVQDSAIMKEQAQRATLLTILAVIYLPLTLVTGIFGMNIRQIDSDTTELWAALVGLAAIAGMTAAGYFGYRHWQRRDARNKEYRRLDDKVYKIA